MDIDATLVWPLKRILPTDENAMYVKLKKNQHYTNFFLASAPNNPDYELAINKIVENIESRSIEQGVYFLTGPMVITGVLDNKSVVYKERKYVCIQGTFTNEYFQYLDKPRSKWTHKKPEDLLK